MGGKYLVATLGCKVNQYESQLIREACESAGLVPARSHDQADVAIVNTCAVTSDALRQSRQAVRRFCREGAASVVVVGCGASAEPEKFKAIEGVTAVWGHDVDVDLELRRLLNDRVRGSSRFHSDNSLNVTASDGERPDDKRNDVWMITEVGEPSSRASSSRIAHSRRMIVPTSLPVVNTSSDDLTHRIERFEGRHRAFLKVQDGCDAFCTYCIIPRLRSRIRSKPLEVAVAEARNLVRSGHKEIILTGIFLGAYGRETAIRRRHAGSRSPLAELIVALGEVPGLVRLRLSSLEPGDLDSTVLEAIATSRVCVPHFHLPLQSGSAAVLRRMNRQYTAEDYVALLAQIRRAFDEPAISTDVIVGFPGETDAEFDETVSVLQEARVLKVHAFPFSPREGTAAWRWRKDFVPIERVRQRMQRLAEVESECSLAYRRALLGRFERVLVEDDPPSGPCHTPNGAVVRHGRTDRFVEVHFETSTAVPGDVVTVRLDRLTPTRTHGTQIRPGCNALALPVLAAATNHATRI